MGRSVDIGAPLARWWGALRHRRDPLPNRAWVGLYFAACLAMGIGAAASWQVPCDDARCGDVRTLWFAWAAAWWSVVISGVMLRSRLKAAAADTRWVSAGIAAMLMLALWLAGYWLGHRG